MASSLAYLPWFLLWVPKVQVHKCYEAWYFFSPEKLGLLNPSTVLREPFGMYCHMHVSIGKIPCVSCLWEKISSYPLLTRSRRAHFISAVVICCVTASLILGGEYSYYIVLPPNRLLVVSWHSLYWLVRIAIKCRRQWSNSRMLLIRNGTSIGLVLRVGITGAFAILAIGLNLKAQSKVS